MRFIRLDPTTIIINDMRPWIVDLVEGECSMICEEIVNAANRAEEEHESE